MRVHSLSIDNYRGIKTLDWVVPSGLVCLVGPGNATKSTILSALDVVLAPRANLSIADTDFYGCNVESPLSITAVITDLPPILENFETYGAFICGITAEGTVVPDPEEGSQRAMAVHFSCDESLEPIWEVVKPEGALEPRRLTVATRRALPFFRVDDRSDQHLRWSRGSHLERLTDDVGGTRSALAEAHRQARRAVFDADLEGLTTTSHAVAAGVAEIGGDAIDAPGVGLDPGLLASGASLVLHNGSLPFTSYGLGQRRLASLAVQRLDRSAASVIVMDEIEQGLEPHRLVRLLHVLRQQAQGGAQVLITTHSPVAVETLDAEMLAVVRSTAGVTTARQVPADLGELAGEPQGTIRSGPSAILAKRVLVVEGATEEGLLRALTESWDTAEANLAMAGAVVRNGQSDTEALRRAECLGVLGFDVAALVDNDKPLAAEVVAAEAAGVQVLRWTAGRCLETEVAHDVPDDLVLPFLELAAEVAYADVDVGRTAVLDAVGAKAPEGATPTWTSITQWNCAVDEVRDAVGAAAADKKWFKTNPRGYALGRWLVSHCHALPAPTDPDQGGLRRTLDEVHAFLYPSEARPSETDASD